MTSDEEFYFSQEFQQSENVLFKSNFTEKSSKHQIVKKASTSHEPHVHHLMPTSYWETLTHMLKGNIGCGILATGSAFKNGGLLFSSILVVVLGTIACYNQYILVTMANKFKQKYNLPSINFAETVGIAFENGPVIFQKMSKFIRWSIKWFIILTQLGFCSVYFLFISQSLDQICFCYNIRVNIHILMLLVFPIIWCTALIKELKYIAPLSTLANSSIFVAFGLIIYNSVTNLPPSISERKLIGDWNELPLCFGVIIYSLEGISLVLPLQQNMKNKERFLGCFGVLNLSLFFVISLITAVGFLGYLKYGDDVKESLTLNLEAQSSMLTQAVISCMAIGILCTYALQFFIPVILILPEINKWMNAKFKTELRTNEFLLRSLLVLITFVTAEVIPHLDLFVSLIGAIGGTFLALIFTPLADISRRHNQKKGIFRWRTIIAVISLLIGIFGFFVGTISTIHEIIQAVAYDLGFR